jgi:hypothetical protein
LWFVSHGESKVFAIKELSVSSGKVARPEFSWRLHPLGGDLAGHWSIWVNGNWRMTFTFEGEDAVSAELAIRLAMCLGGSAQSWMRMQADYDLWQAEHSGKPLPVVERVAA